MNKKILSFTMMAFGLFGLTDVNAQLCDAANDTASRIKDLITKYGSLKADAKEIEAKAASKTTEAQTAVNDADKGLKNINTNITIGTIGSGIALASNAVTMGFLGATAVNQNKTLTNLDTIDLANSDIKKKDIIQGKGDDLKKLGNCLGKVSFVPNGHGGYSELPAYTSIKDKAISAYGTANPMAFYYHGSHNQTATPDLYYNKETLLLEEDSRVVQKDDREVEIQENLDCSSMTVKEFISYAKSGGKSGKCKASDGKTYSVTGATDTHITNATAIANTLIQTMGLDCSDTGSSSANTSATGTDSTTTTPATDRQAQNDRTMPPVASSGVKPDDVPVVTSFAGVEEVYCCPSSPVLSFSAYKKGSQAESIYGCSTTVMANSFEAAKKKCDELKITI